MSRWKPDARGRLEKAALELYNHQGFDARAATPSPALSRTPRLPPHARSRRWR